MKRKIIKIDEDRCTGCGDCIPDCPEGALKIIDGKARLVKESLCDGLGACVGRCPTGALTVEEREAEAFDEEEAKVNMQGQGHQHQHGHGQGGCPGSMMQSFRDDDQEVSSVKGGSALQQWPVQLKLLNPSAPYFQNADLVVAADCVPFSYPNFHERFLKGKILIVFCPKLDASNEEYVAKMTDIIANNDIKSISTIHMEVPCCTGTVSIVVEALRRAQKNIILKDYTISLRGEII